MTQNFSMSLRSLLLSVLAGLACLAIYKLPDSGRDVFFSIAIVAFLSFALIRFRSAWNIFVFLGPFLLLYPSFFGVSKLPPERLLLVCLVLAFIATGSFRSNRKLPFVFWASILFAMTNSLSAVVARSGDAFLRSLTYFEEPLFFLISYRLASSHPRQLYSLIRAICLSAIVVTAMAGVEFAMQRPIMSIFDSGMESAREIESHRDVEDRFGLGKRVASTINQPVYAAVHIVFSLALVLGIMEGSHVSPALKAAVLGAGGLILLATGSRAPILVAVPMAAIWLMFRRRVIPRVMGAIGIAAAALWLSAGGLPQITRHFELALTLNEANSEASNIIGRAELTREMFALFEANPVFGLGPGRIQQLGLAGDPRYEKLAGLENTYATIAADSGLAGLVPYLLLVASCLGTLAVRFIAERRRPIKCLLGSLLLYFGFSSVVAVSVFLPNQMTTTISMAALGTLLASTRPQRFWRRRALQHRTDLTTVSGRPPIAVTA
jgi:hypothetical protein